MEKELLWENFLKSGSVEAYLSYKLPEKPLGRECAAVEVLDRRIDNKNK